MTLPAAQKIAEWRARPQVFVREVFGAEPDPWQDDVLAMFPSSPRIAMQACKGPGKSTTLSWLGWNFLLTRPHPRCAAVSITKDNLDDTLWPEFAKWQNKSPLLLTLFQWTKSRIFAKDHPETWWMSARSFAKSADREAQANTLAGLHEDYVLFLIDEGGSVPVPVLATAEAALSSCKEGHIVMAGNPTEIDGALYHAAVRARNLWRVIEITADPDDPKRTPRVSVEHAREQIEQWGRDNPFVLVNIFGKFPPGGLRNLISIDDLTAATKRSYREDDIQKAARVLGVDVARDGGDASVMFPRQGLVAFQPSTWRNIDGIQGAGAVSAKWRDWEADACFVDNTGGYGASWIDNLRLLGRTPIPVGFSQDANDKTHYANKRAEIYFECANWIKSGGQIPNVTELIQAMAQTRYAFKGDKFIIEDKDQIKAKIGFSPDHADALCLTFAQAVAGKARRIGGQRSTVLPPYDPFADAFKQEHPHILR